MLKSKLIFDFDVCVVRFRFCRSRCSQLNTRWKALEEIDKFHNMVFFSWLQLSKTILVDSLSTINKFDKLILQNVSNCKLRHFGYKLFFVNILVLIT